MFDYLPDVHIRHLVIVSPLTKQDVVHLAKCSAQYLELLLLIINALLLILSMLFYLYYQCPFAYVIA